MHAPSMRRAHGLQARRRCDPGEAVTDAPAGGIDVEIAAQPSYQFTGLVHQSRLVGTPDNARLRELASSISALHRLAEPAMAFHARAGLMLGEVSHILAGLSDAIARQLPRN